VSCPGCGGPRLWGHGYVLRYFFGFINGLWMKRWRCPDCGAVHSCRPEAYLPGMQYPQEIQRMSLEAKLAGKIFLTSLPRQNQQYWWKAFQRQCLETGNFNDLREFHVKNLALGQLWISKRRIYRASWLRAVTPYLPFALTVKKPLVKLE
jgi:hypothetical protein